MLVRLSGEEIGKRWEIIRKAIRASAMPTADTNDEKMSNIQKSLLSGKATCWVEGDKGSPRTLVITSLAMEEVSLTRNLVIYCAHGFQLATSKDYAKMVKGIYKYAVSCKCDNVIMYVWNPKLVALLKKYGGEADYTLVTIPLRSKIEQRRHHVVSR